MQQSISTQNLPNNHSINIPIKFHSKKFSFINLTDNCKVISFKSLIKEMLLNIIKNKKYNFEEKKITENNITIKKSRPPTLVSNKEYDKLTLIQAGFRDSEEIEVLINDNHEINYIEDWQDCKELEDCEINQEKISKEYNEQKKDGKAQPDFSKFSIFRKIIPGDNSCLFNAVNYALNKSIAEPQILRQLIAVEIKSNPELYNSAVLEADPLEYCEWIMRNDTWGGGIELSILSKCFRVRFDVVDIQNNTIEMIGDV